LLSAEIEHAWCCHLTINSVNDASWAVITLIFQLEMRTFIYKAILAQSFEQSILHSYSIGSFSPSRVIHLSPIRITTGNPPRAPHPLQKRQQRVKIQAFFLNREASPHFQAFSIICRDLSGRRGCGKYPPRLWLKYTPADGPGGV
jgi:hypothetical protein